MQCIEGIQPNSSSLRCQPGVVECCWILRNVLRNLDEAGGSTNLRFAGIQGNDTPLLSLLYSVLVQ